MDRADNPRTQFFDGQQNDEGNDGGNTLSRSAEYGGEGASDEDVITRSTGPFESELRRNGVAGSCVRICSLFQRKIKGRVSCYSLDEWSKNLEGANRMATHMTGLEENWHVTKKRLLHLNPPKADNSNDTRT